MPIVERPTYHDTMTQQVDELEKQVLGKLDDFARMSEPGMLDGRWMAVGRTDLEKGFMAIRRSINGRKPS